MLSEGLSFFNELSQVCVCKAVLMGQCRQRVQSEFRYQLTPVLSECWSWSLQVGYRVTYGEGGEIVGVGTSVVLGAVSQTMLPVLQEFSVTFVKVQPNGPIPACWTPSL